MPSSLLELVSAEREEWDPLAHTDTAMLPVITDDRSVRRRPAPVPRGSAGRSRHGRHRKPTPPRTAPWRAVLCAVLAVAAAVVVGSGLLRVLGDAAVAPPLALAVDPAVTTAPAAAQLTTSAPPHPEPVSYWTHQRKRWHPPRHRHHYQHPRRHPHVQAKPKAKPKPPPKPPQRAAPKPKPRVVPKPVPKAQVKPRAAPAPMRTPAPRPAPKAAPKPALRPAPMIRPPAPAPRSAPVGIACGIRQLAGTQPNVSAAGRALMAHFGIREASVLGRGSRGTAGSDHPAGLALDFLVPGIGDRLADYVLAHRAELGVTYVIWRQRINLGSGWQAMADRGSPTANHMDHVHVSFRAKAC